MTRITSILDVAYLIFAVIVIAVLVSNGDYLSASSLTICFILSELFIWHNYRRVNAKVFAAMRDFDDNNG